MEQKFVEGIYFYKPSDKAPDFIKNNITIERDRMIEWLKAQDEKVRVTLKESKGGNLYAVIDNYKKEDKEPNPDEVVNEDSDGMAKKNTDENPDDLPF